MSATVAQVANLNFQKQLQALKAHLPGCVSGEDPLHLHDFRVANRRTRSALREFRDIFPSQDYARFKKDFKWAQKQTNPARDLDVYLEHYPDYRKRVQKNFRKYLQPLQDILKQHRKEAQEDLVIFLESDRLMTTLTDWENLLNGEILEQTHLSQQDAGEFGCQRIIKRYRKLRTRGFKLSKTTPAERFHKYRISIKKLRYTMEFFSSEILVDEYPQLRRSLKSAQDTFGAFQDAEVQAARLREFAEELYRNDASLDTLLAVGQLLGSLNRRHNKRKKKCLKQVQWLTSDVTARTFQSCYQYPVQ